MAREYEDEDDLRQRVLAHRELLEGPDDEEIVRAHVMAAQPQRLLEGGSGLADFCAWAAEQLPGEVVAVDSSARMVQIAAERGIVAVQAAIERLPFAGAVFDYAVATFVLYHIREVDSALAELARVLTSGGRLVASTASDDTHERHARWAELFGEQPQPAAPPLSFSRENGKNLLLRHFQDVEQFDCDAERVFRSRDQLVNYVESLPPMRGLGPRVPQLGEPFRLPTNSTVFLATKPI